jgi:hypothetical protein
LKRLKEAWGREATQFRPGQSGIPSGRPRGSRNKLSENFIGDLQTLWGEQNYSILQRVADEHPEKLLQAMVQILPKGFQVHVGTDQINWVVNATPALSNTEWAAKYAPKSSNKVIEPERYYTAIMNK